VPRGTIPAVFSGEIYTKKEVVWSLPTVENGTPTDAAGVDYSHKKGGTVTSGNSPQTTSNSKGTNNSETSKGNGGEIAVASLEVPSITAKQMKSSYSVPRWQMLKKHTVNEWGMRVTR